MPLLASYSILTSSALSITSPLISLASTKRASSSSAKACSDSREIRSRRTSGFFLISETMLDTRDGETLNSLARSAWGSQPQMTLSAISSFYWV